MHSKRLVHLDIKPDNILIDLNGDAPNQSAEEGEERGGDGTIKKASANPSASGATGPNTQDSSSEDGDPSPVSLAAAGTPVPGSCNNSPDAAPDGNVGEASFGQAAADAAAAAVADVAVAVAVAVACQQAKPEEGAKKTAAAAADASGTPKSSRLRKVQQTNVSSDSGE